MTIAEDITRRGSLRRRQASSMKRQVFHRRLDSSSMVYFPDLTEGSWVSSKKVLGDCFWWWWWAAGGGGPGGLLGGPGGGGLCIFN